jgi:hypothetical protein
LTPRSSLPTLPALQNDGRLVVKDGTGATIWSSGTEGGSSSAAQGWLYQITSGGLASTRCIASGPAPAAVWLVSPSRRFSLQVSQQGAALALMDANGTAVWAPQDAQPGSPPARLCITAAGQLQLTGGPYSTLLWSSSYAMGPGSQAPFVAQVSDAGCLEVLDGQCARLYSSTAGSSQAVGAGLRTSPLSEPSAGKRTVEQPRRNKPVVAGGPSAVLRTAPGTTQASGGATLLPAKRLGPSPRPSPRPSPATSAKATKPPTKKHPPAAKKQRPSPAPKRSSSSSSSSSQPLAGLLSKVPKAAPINVTSFPTAAKVPATRTGSKANKKTGLLSKLAPKVFKQCALPAMSPCGGVELCGKDAPCQSAGCCKAPAACRRTSEFVWLCK